MEVLGPYIFLEEGAEPSDCDCGYAKPSPLEIGDRITFQIPASETCCGNVEGCPEINEACFESSGMEVNFDPEDYTVTELGLCIDSTDFSPPDYLVRIPDYNFENGKQYRITACITGNETGIDYSLFLNIPVNPSVTSSTFTGNGTFTFVLTANDTGAGTFGILNEGGDDTVRLCIQCLTICEAKTFTAELTDGSTTSPISLTEMPNGNLQANFLISGEVAPGCYTVNLTNDCDDEVLVSNEINIRENWGCSLLFKWRDDKNVFGYDYSDTNYFNQYRVLGMLKNPRYGVDKSIKALSNNTHKQANAIMTKKTTAQLNDTPEYAMDAVALATIHQEFYINDVRYVVGEGDIEPVWRKSNQRAAPIAFEVLPQNFDGINNLC